MPPGVLAKLDRGLPLTSEEQGMVDAMPGVAVRLLGDGVRLLDLPPDVLDPAFAPGTGTPEIGGLASWQAQAILRQLRGLAFRGMDVVEVSPPYDVSEITALAAATVVWEYLALLAVHFTR